MRGRVLDYWSRLRSSYWFIPAVMTAGAIVLSSTVIAIDDRVGVSWVRNLGWFYQNQPEGARAVLSSIAGSMITVAGVTFSMTLLAVSHASSQMGPRLLSGFMRDTGNQVTLGIFVSTFVYCLLVLRTVRGGTLGGENNYAISPFVPHLGVIVALALALASVAVLIYFFHHVPRTLSVSHVIARTGDEFLESVRTLFPAQMGAPTEEFQSATAAREKLASRFPEGGRCIGSAYKGYVRAIDAESISRVATKRDVVLEVLSRPGDFVYERSPLLRAWPSSRLDQDAEEELRGAFTLGTQRSLSQDVMFPVDQLVELATRALSPGVNDPFTAVECLHQLESGLVELTRHAPPAACRIDEGGNLRVVADPWDFGEIADRIFNRLRTYGRHDAIVYEELLGAIERTLDSWSLRPTATGLRHTPATSTMAPQWAWVTLRIEYGCPRSTSRLGPCSRRKAAAGHALGRRRRCNVPRARTSRGFSRVYGRSCGNRAPLRVDPPIISGSGDRLG